MKVRYSWRAQDDLQEIYNYLQPRSPAGAQHVLASIRAAIGFIADYPAGSEHTENPAVLVKTVGRYPYRIFYSVSGDSITVLHIRHASRRPYFD